MSDIIKRINHLTSYEIRSLIADLKECESYERILNGCNIDHMTQAEIRTLFARHECPISEAEVRPACTEIARRAQDLKNHMVYPEEIFPQEID